MQTPRMIGAVLAVLICAVVGAWAGLCVKCQDGMYTADVGQCSECRGTTSRGAFQLCKACSDKLHQCERCRTPLGAVSKVSPQQAQERVAEYRAKMEKEYPGSTQSPGADVERQTATVVAKWFEALNNQDVAGVLAVSATPFSWDAKTVANEAELEKILTRWTKEMASQKKPLKFSGPVFVCQAPVPGVGDKLVWMVAFDQSGRTDDAITFYVTVGQSAKVVGFRD